MKYVYVLVSSENDLYYEQCLMSVWTLRLYMPNAHVAILCDDITEKSFSGNRSALRELASEIKSIPFEADVKNAERSRLIKTSIPNYVQGDFLYIDCDTIICGDLSSIEEYDFQTAGVLDGHVMLEEHVHRDYFLSRDKKLGFHGTKTANCNINGGIILCRGTEEGRALFSAWNEAWKYSAYKKHDLHDQSALNEANFRTGLKMQLLSGEWNCQPSHGGLAFLKDAKIIHYYSSEFAGKHYIPYYKLADKALQQRIKEAGGIPVDIQEMLREPKFQFNKVHLINDRRIVDIMQSPLVFTLADIKAHCPAVFSILEGIARTVRAVGKKIGKRKK
ncbi:MAG: putative nucleotide-diphospho-sugar transferase [Bacteroides sp.]|nr:putative nucleotide-diphospho-sugar transferase [Prevotella sp.]MCM1407857.1 putative nucleotide-diphospho-sugar transferase [Treponema brennaborense]MCM1469599.1 putative nucleotide-diphospho-sugar transferase [Bacteroides sp.]